MAQEYKSTLFGRKLRGWRIDSDKTQAELAAEIGIRQGTLSDWEIGKRMPRGAMLARMLKLIGADDGVRAAVFEEVAQR